MKSSLLTNPGFPREEINDEDTAQKVMSSIFLLACLSTVSHFSVILNGIEH